MVNERSINIIERTLLLAFRIALRQHDKIVTQKTYKSLRVQTTKSKSYTIIDLYAHKSLGFIERGRKAGGKMPPPKPISEWIKARKIQFYSKNGRALSLNSMTFLISRSIANKGIKPTPIVQKAENIFLPIVKKIIKDATKIDIQNKLKK